MVNPVPTSATAAALVEAPVRVPDDKTPDSCQYHTTQYFAFLRKAGRKEEICPNRTAATGYSYCLKHLDILRRAIYQSLKAAGYSEEIAAEAAEKRYPVFVPPPPAPSAPTPPPAPVPPPHLSTTAQYQPAPAPPVPPARVEGVKPPVPSQGRAAPMKVEEYEQFMAEVEARKRAEAAPPAPAKRMFPSPVHIPQEEMGEQNEVEVSDLLAESQDDAAPAPGNSPIRRFPLRSMSEEQIISVKQAALGAAVDLIKDITSLEETPYPRLINQIRYLTLEFYRIVAEENETIDLEAPEE